MASNKDLLQKFLKGIETGSAMAADVVDDDNYKQHNPQTREGGEGIASLFKRIAKTNPKVKFMRVFEDGDFAFAHNEYDFDNVKVAFEVFRFEGQKAVEHWDNIQRIAGPNLSGRGMLDGETQITDLDKTEVHRQFCTRFVEEVLINGSHEMMHEYLHQDLVQHDPESSDGLDALLSTLQPNDSGKTKFKYSTLHRVLAEGNFVLCMCEGEKNGIHSGIFDLYRLENGRIIEHWNTIDPIPPRELWKNDNGKF